MKRILAAAGLTAILAGCAALTPDCGSDWYEVGQNDGRIGASSQVERYAKNCSGIDRKRYEEGHAAGIAARPRIPSF
jgi:hypothetical protein